ncbi:MAG: hypothetical protein WCN98_08485 [Verrucomicrobiaceae bacterium]
MGTKISADNFISQLAKNHRVLLLGGMAVIAHGLSRKTKDVDVWLDPLGSCKKWADELSACASSFPAAHFWSLAEQRHLQPDEIADQAAAFGVLRVSGFDRDIDVFLKPNELEIERFDVVWSNAKPMEDGTRLPDEIDLFETKANTGREHDWQDQLFLESLVKKRFRERLPVCDLAEAQSLLDRFLDPECLQFALENPNTEVREVALKHLCEFESEGDPYSRDILAEWRKKNPA